MTTWLKGTTTWGNLVSDLTKLIAGEMADSVSTTCAAGDKWSRVDALDDTLISNSAADVALGNMSNRAGYATLISYKPTVGSLTDGGQTMQQSVLRQKTICTSSPTTRWFTRFTVQTANSVSGNYSTAAIAILVYNADTGANILNTAVGVAADGSFTGAYGATYQVTDPSGTLTAGTMWVRGFTSTYVGGIDTFGPLFQKRRANATFSVNPPGVAGTDYDANVDIAATTTTAAVVTNVNSHTAWGGGGFLSGLGIKTNTGLGSGNLYTFSYSAAMHTMRLVNNASNGLVDLFYGGRRIDNGGTFYQVNGHKVDTFLRVAQTISSVTSGMAIQYWLAVAKDRVIIVLNGDPIGTGKLTANGLGVFNARFGGSGYDKFPIFVGYPVTDFLASSSPVSFIWNGGINLYAQKIRQDGSESRDWQTGWCRQESYVIFGSADELTMSLQWENNQNLASRAMTFIDTPWANLTNMIPAREEKPSRFDSKWHMYPMWLADSPRTSSDTTFRVGSKPRGRIDSVPFIPGDSWVNGDELTDSVSGNKYFLCAADYHGTGAMQRFSLGNGTYAGGAAILENA